MANADSTNSDRERAGGSMKNGTDLLAVVDTANMAKYTLGVARDLVNNGIGGDGCDVDELTVLSCVLDRAAARLGESIAIADKMRKA